MGQDGMHFFTRKDRRHTSRPFGTLNVLEVREGLVQHMAVQEEQGV